MSTSDRELLELAAKAAGYVVRWLGDSFMHGPTFAIEVEPGNPCGFEPWNPLEDDGDALRLAAALNLSIIINWGFNGKPSGSVGAMLGCHEDLKITTTKYDGNPCRAWRHAIVRAAAEIGKSMEGK